MKDIEFVSSSESTRLLDEEDAKLMVSVLIPFKELEEMDKDHRHLEHIDMAKQFARRFIPKSF